jgi:uncharacterized protein
MKSYIIKLENIFIDNNVCPSHGIEHALNTLNNVENMLLCCKYNLSNDEKLSVKLAALLHDADDRKVFPNNKDNENTKNIINDVNNNILNLVLRMINLTATSKNKDTVPDDAIKNPWLLFPRYADRLEAIGKIGILRALQYTKSSKMMYYNNDTILCKNEKELLKIASLERFNNYNGISASMIDHYYDKLIFIGLSKIDNDYAENLRVVRIKIMMKFIISFGKNGHIDDNFIHDFLEKYDE